MASSVSYTITRENNATEKEGIGFVLEEDLNLINPTKEMRRKLMEDFDISNKFRRAFDLIWTPIKRNAEDSEIIVDKDTVRFVELKTTKKKLPDNPRGFFFGATENEFELAEILGERYRFCFVSLHPDSKSHAYLSLQELEAIIKNKRVQYQINLER